jgi:hypothetical protein
MFVKGDFPTAEERLAFRKAIRGDRQMTEAEVSAYIAERARHTEDNPQVICYGKYEPAKQTKKSSKK